MKKLDLEKIEKAGGKSDRTGFVNDSIELLPPEFNGYVQKALLEVQPDLSKAAVYACGSDAMIHSARRSMFEAGLPSNRFYSDAFVSSAAN